MQSLALTNIGRTNKYMISKNILRTIVERLSRGKVIKRSISVGNLKGTLFATPDAQLKYLRPGVNAFDQDLINIAEKHINRGDSVWDIGANIGVFTVACALKSQSGQIVAIEADTWLAGLLRKTAARKEYSQCNICVVPLAISEANSISSFMVATRGRASNALTKANGRSQMGGTRETQYVPTLTLDTLLEEFSKPDFIKIDIEGAELMALSGGTTLINVVRPKFYIEVGEDVADQIYKIFNEANYQCIDPESNRQIKQCTTNTLFIPR